jgi:hypothetical protein
VNAIHSHTTKGLKAHYVPTAFEACTEKGETSFPLTLFVAKLFTATAHESSIAVSIFLILSSTMAPSTNDPSSDTMTNNPPTNEEESMKNHPLRIPLSSRLPPRTRPLRLLTPTSGHPSLPTPSSTISLKMMLPSRPSTTRSCFLTSLPTRALIASVSTSMDSCPRTFPMPF